MQLSTQTDKDLTRYALSVMASLLIIPFNLTWRMPPYMDFYQDIFVVFSICLIFLIVLSCGKLLLPLSRPAVYFLLLAGYWVLQSGILDLPYPEQNWRVAFMFAAVAALCWSIQALLAYYGREKIITWVMWAVLIGVAIQSVVVILQFTGLAKQVSWLVFYIPERVNGQLGQRNLLGHQLMWGVLAATYLTAQGRVKFWLGVGMVAFLGGIMGLVNSRAIMVYIVALLFLLTVLRGFGGKQQGKFSKYLLVAVLWVFAAQWLTPAFFDLFSVSAESSIQRMQIGNSIEDRLTEWRKAWAVFQEHPLWGSGWHSYAYQSFLKDIAFKPETIYHRPSYPSHCHNSVLQIMAEMGIVGLIIVLGGLIWVLLPLLKQFRKGENQILLALLTVTLSHSLVEFPLWLTYFLAAAAVFTAVGQPQPSASQSFIVPRAVQLFCLLTGLAGILVTGTLFGLHQWRISQLIKATNGEVVMLTIRMHAGFKFGSTIPLLTPYRDRGTLIFADAAEEDINWSKLLVAKKLSKYQPTEKVVMLHGLYLYRQGKKQESLEWMKKVWNFYPRMVPKTMKVVYTASPMFKGLEQPVYETCVRLRQTGFYLKAFKKECELPPDEKEQSQGIAEF